MTGPQAEGVDSGLLAYLRHIKVNWRIYTNPKNGRKWVQIPLDKLKIAEGGAWSIEAPEEPPARQSKCPSCRRWMPADEWSTHDYLVCTNKT